MGVLLEFSAFNSLAGLYKQKEGLSMGGKVSPCLANIFVNMMEMDIIKKHIESGNIISYHRYVNDICCIVKKGLKDEILDEMNKFDHHLKFTEEPMLEGKLNFLDTTITFENNQIILKQYRKPEASDCLINFKKGVAPKA